MLSGDWLRAPRPQRTLAGIWVQPCLGPGIFCSCLKMHLALVCSTESMKLELLGVSVPAPAASSWMGPSGLRFSGTSDNRDTSAAGLPAVEELQGSLFHKGRLEPGGFRGGSCSPCSCFVSRRT